MKYCVLTAKAITMDFAYLTDKFTDYKANNITPAEEIDQEYVEEHCQRSRLERGESSSLITDGIHSRTIHQYGDRERAILCVCNNHLNARGNEEQRFFTLHRIYST